MSPFLQRKLRAMSVALVVILSVVVAGALAWSVRRMEASRVPAATACSRVLDEVFAGAAATADSVLLQRLLTHRDQCVDDPAWVDQARRLMGNTQRVADARDLLAEAERRRTFTPDELSAQTAWVDLGESHIAWTNGDEARATSLHARAVDAADRLRQRWPEWPTPYRLLEEAGRANIANPQAVDYDHLRRSARGRIISGAFLRGFSDLQAVVFFFVTALLGMLALCAAVSGLIETRQLVNMPTSSIAAATPGYVALEGTLHLPPNADAVIGPQSKTRGVWYESASRLGFKGSRTWRERSVQPFVLRDASGDAVVDPPGMTVRTRHSATSFGSGWDSSSRRRTTERMLLDGESVYVTGQLGVTSQPAGAGSRHVRVAENGRRLLVSTFSRSQLIAIERLWLLSGALVMGLALVVLLWSYHQRYQVTITPG